MCCPYVAMSWGYHTLVWSVDSQRNTHENVWKKGAVTLGNVSYILQQHCETRCGLHVTRCNVSSNPPKNRRLIRNGGGGVALLGASRLPVASLGASCPVERRLFSQSSVFFCVRIFELHM